jgi:Tfp pilus assembly protein PilZ
MRERATRFPRRLQVRFWPQDDVDSAYVGYSRNVSMTGMFVATVHPMKPGRLLEIHFRGEGYDFRLRGQVIHAAKVSPMLQAVRPSGMGIRFLGRSLELERLLPVEERSPDKLEQRVYPVYFSGAKALVDSYERDVRNGGLFVPTSRPAQLDERVAIEVHLPRPSDPVLTFRAKVVHRVAEGEQPGMGIAFEEQSEVINRLGAVVDSYR